MEWPKLKNLIILVLLIVNSFLLVLVGARWQESVSYERTALEQTIQVLERGGIHVEADAVTPADGLHPMAVERDLAREARLARTLLGEEVQGDNRGGGLYRYRGALGEVSFRPGGELSAELAGGPGLSADGDPERHAAGLLSKMGVDGSRIGVTEEDGWTRVRFRQTRGGRPLFSCEVEFTYRDDALRAVQGALLAAPDGTAERAQAMTLPTALTRFAEEIAATGDVCSAIQSMEPGWRGTVQPMSGGVRLAPAWLVTTDTARYYLDCATGALTRIPDP